MSCLLSFDSSGEKRKYFWLVQHVCKNLEMKENIYLRKLDEKEEEMQRRGYCAQTKQCGEHTRQREEEAKTSWFLLLMTEQKEGPRLVCKQLPSPEGY